MATGHLSPLLYSDPARTELSIPSTIDPQRLHWSSPRSFPSTPTEPIAFTNSSRPLFGMDPLLAFPFASPFEIDNTISPRRCVLEYNSESDSEDEDAEGEDDPEMLPIIDSSTLAEGQMMALEPSVQIGPEVSLPALS
jgi:hypothetical protein